MQIPDSKRRSSQPFCDRCTKNDEEILVSVSPKYLKPSKDNPNDMVLKNRNPFPVYFKACATNMNAFEPQPMTGRISPLSKTTISIPFYAPATPIRNHEEVIILISQRPFFLPEGNACRFCFKPHDDEEMEHVTENFVGEYTEMRLGENRHHELVDYGKKATFKCKHCNSQVQANNEGSNAEHKKPLTNAEAEQKTKGRRACHIHTCKAHQKDRHKSLPANLSSSDHSDMVCLCLSADDIQSQKFYTDGECCKECSGTKTSKEQLANNQMNQQYQYKVFPTLSSISDQKPVVCNCAATHRNKEHDVVLQNSNNKDSSAKNNGGSDDEKKQIRHRVFRQERKTVTGLPTNLQDSDGSSCYCNKRAHIQARIVKAKDNNAVTDEDSSTIISEDSKREKRTRFISERVTTKREKIEKEHKDSFETTAGCHLNSEKPSRYQRKRKAMIVALDKKCTKILKMGKLTFVMISLLMAIVLGIVLKHNL